MESLTEAIKRLHASDDPPGIKKMVKLLQQEKEVAMPTCTSKTQDPGRSP